MRQIAVFCGSQTGRSPVYGLAAERFGLAVARSGCGLVYGGGRIGLMGRVADAVLAGGGTVIGVIPEALSGKEIAHSGLTELRIVRSMHERKAMMADLADAFIALPGGFGTLDELCEILTWVQLGLHHKAVGLLNVEGFFDPLLAMLDHAVGEGFLRLEHRAVLHVDNDPERLLQTVLSAEPTQLKKWIGPGES